MSPAVYSGKDSGSPVKTKTMPTKNSSSSLDNSSIDSSCPMAGEEYDSVAIELHRMSAMMIILTITASISGFLFGYDTGYISAALVMIKEDLSVTLTTGDKSLITSSTSLGALLGALIAGTIADIHGRKWVITGANILFLVGAGAQTGAKTVWTMIIGRFIMGWGVGIASLIAPLYISEMAPARFRGRLVVINVLAITGGQVIAYGIGAGLTNVHNGWRILVGISMIPAAAQMIIFAFLPETPRFLVRAGRKDEAKAVLNRIYASASDDELDHKVIDLVKFTQSTFPEGTGLVKRLYLTFYDLYFVPGNLRALIIACGLQGVQQFCGWNSLVYFSATVFQSVGFKNATAVSLIITCTNFLFTCVAFLIIDRVGRRRILICTVWGMSLALVICSIAFHYLPPNLLQSHGNAIDNKWASVIIFSLMLFAAFYATGIGNVPWQQSELFPMNVRGLGTSMATATNWAGSLVVSSTFLTMLNNITPTGTFAFYAGLCAVGWCFCFYFYPETANLNLEEVQDLLKDGFNINKSVENQKAIKQMYKSRASGDDFAPTSV
ncbi:Myo-inositol transporter [Nadsonia fulvescens var. elongata DSM 6958]|uniref:Myo-inositol transporter n=1 Tax=Nadsonia fulvescens var. elongata DSM 6958 TaxID=857566 RepID=A0A1E3PKL4_9ASCO|nr:Myo-inositol transporter [Nadsonia fulvescens var. elongata DSM 6958]